ncbi:hypothetical protein D9611_002893 [Ephemerocybe angulata]|uniref:MARVEL domain-containing protein n=1 Tax=Ephemerocybe angulata TaxID=980116 RepID=A0A8H5C903_9AGAR|nr:hypothetical protein D9611_002893 [Tulosesus angulatus]
MADFNRLLPLARTIIFGIVAFFSIIVLGISAHLVSLPGPSPDYVNLALATSILTLIALPIIFIIPLKRRGAAPSFVAVEVVTLWLLWILWLATGATIANWLPGLVFCNGGVCSELRAIEAFAFLNWLMLMFYSFVLLTLAVTAHHRGRTGVWKSSVPDFDWNHKSTGVVGV